MKSQFRTDPEMLEWQYSQILWELGEIQRHDADPTCPCRLSTDLGENCLAKHTLGVSGLAAETMAMDPDNAELLDELAAEAREKHQMVKAAVCSAGEAPELMDWSRQWRKRIEPLYYACSAKKAKLHDPDTAPSTSTSIARLFEPVTVTGKCTPAGGCTFKVKAVQPGMETEAVSVSALEQAIKRVAAPAPTPGPRTASDRTYALGITGDRRYEFQYKVLSLKDLVVSHDPFTFTPNPDYPQELQPRLRDRAATRLQVENIAANLNPAALTDDYHSIDRGAPIIGPDRVVESGNGRVMALMLAAEKHPEQYAKYVGALRTVLPTYGITTEVIDRVQAPVLVRQRLTDVSREQFVQEANASTSIEASAVEKARTDAQRVTPDMIAALEVLEGESIEEALRSARNKAFVSAFLGKLPANEQARLVDAKGVLNQDGVRRAAMALFVATFKGDVGIRLAEKFYESTDLNVRNVFNGIARSLGLLARAETLVAAGERQAGYIIGEDLARAVNVFSAIKKTPGMTVTKYLSQMQLEQRELTPFQERLLSVLDEHSRSARRTAAILGGYAQLVIDSPPPSQASFMPGAVVAKEELFETAVRRAVEASVEDVAKLFDMTYKPHIPKPAILESGVATIIPAEFDRFQVELRLERAPGWTLRDAPVVDTPAAVQQFFELMREADREYVLVVCLDTRLRLVGLFEQSIGTRDTAMVDPMEVARIALATNATSLILAHNHPTGDPGPSAADMATFRLVKDALKKLDIDVLDFFVVGHKEDYSMEGQNRISAPLRLGLTPRAARTVSSAEQARLLDYSWLAQKVDKCNLSTRDVGAALGWRPLRDFVAYVVGLGKPVSLCSAGMVYGTYQLTIGGLQAADEVTAITRAAAKVPSMKRVLQFGSKDMVYQVTVPADKKEQLTWSPQQVVYNPVRKEPSEQPALFDGGAAMKDASNDEIARLAGATYVDIEVSSVDRTRSEHLKALVDTGSEVTKIPPAVMAQLGLRPLRLGRFRTADNRQIERPVYDAKVTLNGETTNTDIVAMEGTPVLGLLVLEALGYKVNPVTRQLEREDLNLLSDLGDPGPVIRVTGKCDDSSIESCVFKIRKVGEPATVQGQKALSEAIEKASYGRAKITVRMETPRQSGLPVCSSAQMEKRERLIQVLKARNKATGCDRIEGSGTKKCPNVFAVATSRIGCRPGKASVRDPELEEVGNALEKTEVVDV